MLSTCNRTELYLVVGDPVEAEAAVLGVLARRAGIRPTELVDSITALRNCDAARHLYRVASGLESMVVGEAEVQGQVKRAYEAALAARSTGPLTNQLFRAALATGKRVRTETAIAAGGASVASVAVDLAKAALGDLAERRVLIIGAGETAELTAQALHAQGVKTLFVANRRRERAVTLARRFGGDTIAFDALPAELERADIVVASTGSPHAILGVDDLGEVMAARDGRPLLLIDLAVPRDIEPECDALDGVTLVDIDGLQAQVARNRLVRRAEARKAEGIVEEEIHTFAGWLGHAGDAADRRRAARARRGDRRPGPGRERRPLGAAVRARPRARRGGRPGGRQPVAARADGAHAPAGPRPPSRHAAAPARALRPRGAGRPPRRRPDAEVRELRAR